MERTPQLSVSYLLRKLVAGGEEIVSRHHPWLWEHNRWKELVFCILTQTVSGDQERLRVITDHLDILGLIQIESLAALVENGQVNFNNNRLADELLDFLMENGFEKTAAEKSVVSLAEVADGIHKNFDGKVQHYLRTYGELLLKDLPKKFKFSQLDSSQARQVFIFWMQNVLTLPLSLEDETMKIFAGRYGVEPADLIKEADEMGLNLSLLDDLIQASHLSEHHEL
jgi:hypothetical protein